MEIVNKNVAFLTNCEVFGLLQQTKEDLAKKVLAKKNHKQNQQANLTDQQSVNIDKHLPTVVYESLRFLENTPCVSETSEVINNFLIKLDERKDEFTLTNIVKLQLINQRPSSAVELQVLIEDNEERFTLEQMDDLLDFVIENLPGDSSEIDQVENNQIDQDA